MHETMEKLQRACGKIIAGLGILMFGYLVFYAWTSSARIYASSEIAVWSEDGIWKNLLFTAGILASCAGIGVLADRVSNKALRVAAVECHWQSPWGVVYWQRRRILILLRIRFMYMRQR